MLAFVLAFFAFAGETLFCACLKLYSGLVCVFGLTGRSCERIVGRFEIVKSIYPTFDTARCQTLEFICTKNCSFMNIVLLLSNCAIKLWRTCADSCCVLCIFGILYSRAVSCFVIRSFCDFLFGKSLSITGLFGFVGWLFCALVASIAVVSSPRRLVGVPFDRVRDCQHEFGVGLQRTFVL